DDYLAWRVQQPLPSKRKRKSRSFVPKLTAPTTANNELRRIAAFLNWGTMRRRYLIDNPARGFEYLAVERRKKRALRLDEIKKMAAVSNPLLRDILLTLAHVGCRISELLRLRVECLDLKGYE